LLRKDQNSPLKSNNTSINNLNQQKLLL